MKDEKLLKSVVQILINGEDITLDSLRKANISTADISYLEKEGIIVRSIDGLFKIDSIKILYDEGKRYFALKEYAMARKYFECALIVNPKHFGTNFQLFLLSIIDYRFEDAVYYLAYLTDNHRDEFKSDYCFYWLLLSNIVDLPLKYKELINNLEFDDIRVDSDKRQGINLSEIDLINAIRKNALRKKFMLALRSAKELRIRHKKYTNIDLITKILLNKAHETQFLILKSEINYLHNKDYEGLENYLKSLIGKSVCGLKEAYLLKLIGVLKDIKSLNRLPQVKVAYTNNVFDAIDCENYPFALSLARSFSKENGGKYYENPIELILSDIVEVLEETKKYSSLYSSKKLEAVIKSLYDNNLENFNIKLNEFLSFIHKEEFESVVNDILKLEIDSDVTNFEQTISLLINLNKTKQEVDISLFIEKFYDSLINYDLYKAHVYFDLLKKMEMRGVKANCKDLELLLASTEDEVLKKNKLEYEEMLIDKINADEEEYDIIIDDYLLDMHDYLLNNNLVACLIRSNDDEIKRYMLECEYFSDIKAFKVGSNIIMIKSLEYDDDYNTIRELACKSFKEENYSCCSNYLAILLGSASSPNIYMAKYFKMLGICYFKTGVSDLAFEYLSISKTIYDSLGIDGELDLYFKDLEGTENDEKYGFIMDLADFYNKDNDNHQKIKKIS